MNDVLLPPHPFAGLRRQTYRVILVDPPWHFSCGLGKRSRHPCHHYRTMKLADIAALPVKDLAHPAGARLLMWATIPFLPQACSLIKQWGFRYSTSRVWIKTWPKNAEPPWDRRSFTHGSGYEVLGNPELLMVGKIGKPKGIPPPRPRALMIAPRREHSRKPDEIRQEIIDRFEGPFCELFARSAWSGFDVWGNETERFNDLLSTDAA